MKKLFFPVVENITTTDNSIAFDSLLNAYHEGRLRLYPLEALYRRFLL